MRLKLYFFLIVNILSFRALAQCPAGPVSFTATTTSGTCPSDGSITVTASGGTAPYQYEIVTGPVLRPLQSSNIFNALPPGSYLVKVNDQCGTLTTNTIVVAGSYVLPTVSIAETKVSCPGGSDGVLTITMSGGSAPFSYSLIAPSVVTVGPQASNVFNNLPKGSYTVQVVDACNTVRSQSFTLSEQNVGSPILFIANTNLIKVSCNNIQIPITVTVPSGKTLATPIEYSIIAGQQTFPPQSSNVFIVPQGGMYTVKIVDACGQTVVQQVNTDPTGDVGADFACSNMALTMTTKRLLAPITYEIIAGPQLAGPQASNVFPGLPEGGMYVVQATDACGMSVIDSGSFTRDEFRVDFATQIPACDTPKVRIFFAGHYFTNPITINYLSGPYSYPSQQVSGAAVFYATSVLPGTYTVEFIDGCNNKDTVTFTANNSYQGDVTYNVNQLCNGGEIVDLDLTNNMNSSVSYSIISGPQTFPPQLTNYFYNLTSGTYVVQSEINSCTSSGFPIRYRDTIVIEPYYTPDIITTGVLCQASNMGEVFCTASQGIGPYQFEIISGPITVPPQSNNLFQNLPDGQYQVRVIDNCGNSAIQGVELSTYGPDNIHLLSQPVCENDTLRIYADTLPHALYHWTGPNGFTSTSRYIEIPNFQYADTGTYYLHIEYNTCVNLIVGKLILMNAADAEFTSTDMCGNTSNIITITGLSGGVFSLNPDPLDGATINASTGVISNPTANNSYTIRYTVTGVCTQYKDVTITALPNQDATFSIADFCDGGTPVVQTTMAGGTFSFNTAPTDGAQIDAATGIISSYTSGTTYDIKYTFSGACGDSTTDQVTILNVPSAAFTFDDYCFGSAGLPQITGTSGGTFSFNTLPNDGAQINATTGELTSTTVGTQYDIKYAFGGGCVASQTDLVTVMVNADATFSIDDFCDGGNNIVQTNQPGGVFSFDLPAGGAQINGNTGIITNYTAGTTYSVKYTIAGVCGDSMIDQVTVLNQVDPSFTFDDYCAGTSGLPQITGTSGGTFSFNIIPADNAQINATSGAISNGTVGAQYSVAYGFSGSCGVSQIETVSILPLGDADFTFADFCDGGANGPQVNQTGGLFSFNTPPADAAQIDANTGILTNYTAGSTYDIKYTISGACGDVQTDQVTVLNMPDPSFVYDDYCDKTIGSPQITGTPGGVFSFNVTPTDGAQIDANTGLLSSTTAGTSYAIKYSFGGSCSADQIKNVMVIPAEDATFSMSDFCFGSINQVQITQAGGVFSFDVAPLDAAVIDVNTGVISDATSGASYTVKYSIAGTCPDSKIQTVSVMDQPDASFVYNSYCFGDLVLPTPTQSGGVYSFNILPADGAQIDATNGELLGATVGSNYVVKYSFGGSCPTSNIQSVEVYHIPDVQFTPLYFCEDEVLELTDQSSVQGGGNIVQWNWEIDQTSVGSSQNMTADLAVGSHEIILTATDNHACHATLLKNIEIYSTPIALFDGDNTCENKPLVEFTDQSNISTGTIVGWSWDFGNGQNSTNKNPSFSYPATGTYPVLLEVTSDAGCKANYTKNIEVYPKPEGLVTSSKLFDCGTLCTDLIFTSNQDITHYEWMVGNHLYYFNSANPQLCISEAGEYGVSVIIGNSFGCFDTLINTNYLEVYKMPVSNFSTDKVEYDFPGDQVVISDSSQEAEVYLWTFGDGDESTNTDPVHLYTDTGIYKITQTVTTEHGCVDSSSKTVRFIPEFHIYIPNAFTPGDGDGINDIFKAEGIGVAKENFQFYIFNRWGDIVFDATSIDIGWDGKDYQGGPAKQDVYSYKLQAQEYSGKIHEISGSVTLIR